MSCLPVPGLSRCHLLSSAAAFSVILAVSRPGSPDIGAAVRFAVTFGAIQNSQTAAPGAACWKKKIGDQSGPWPPPAWSAAAIPEPGSASSRWKPF